MEEFLRCKHCGGYVKLAEEKESYLDISGCVIDEDVLETQYYKCENCNRTAYRLSELTDAEEIEDQGGIDK